MKKYLLALMVMMSVGQVWASLNERTQNLKRAMEQRFTSFVYDGKTYAITNRSEQSLSGDQPKTNTRDYVMVKVLYDLTGRCNPGGVWDRLFSYEVQGTQEYVGFEGTLTLPNQPPRQPQRPFNQKEFKLRNQYLAWTPLAKILMVTTGVAIGYGLYKLATRKPEKEASKLVA